MKTNRIYLSITLAVLCILLAACNGDIFIKPLKVKADTDSLGPDCRTAFIKVTGENWYVSDMWYTSGETYVYQGVLEDDSYSFKLSNVEINGHIVKDGIKVNLVSYLAEDPATIGVTVTDGYDYIPLQMRVYPTGEYDIEILDVSYNQKSWLGYPDEDFTTAVLTVQFTEGLAEPTEYSFQTPGSLPGIYWFFSYEEDNDFAQKLLDSGIAVPIPSFANKGWFWEMSGEEAPLRMSQTNHDFTVLPRMPKAVELPAGKPLKVSLLCSYESVGLECAVKAVNPLTGEAETVQCILRMIVPVKFETEVTEL